MTQIVKRDDQITRTGGDGDADRPTFAPRTDIVEVEAGYLLLADLPGADESTLEVTLEKDVLTIQAQPAAVEPEGAHLAYGEYESGDFYRSFRISEQLDSSKIEASLENGVLRVLLPRPAKVSRRIEVRQVS